MVFRPLYYQCMIIEKTLELLNLILKFKEKNHKALRRALNLCKMQEITYIARAGLLTKVI